MFSIIKKTPVNVIAEDKQYSILKDLLVCFVNIVVFDRKILYWPIIMQSILNIRVPRFDLYQPINSKSDLYDLCTIEIQLMNLEVYHDDSIIQYQSSQFQILT